MKITMYEIENEEMTFTLDMVGDWAIYARAKDKMLEKPDMDEDTAIRWAVESEDSDFRVNMKMIREWRFNVVDGVTIYDDDTFTLEDDFYTDEHMVEISKALETELAESREDSYEEEKEWSWYHR